MTSESGSHDGERPEANGEACHDALGDTHLGRSLKELIEKISKETDALQKGLASGTEIQDAGAFEPSPSCFDQALELAAATRDGAGSVETDPASAADDSSAPQGVAVTTDPASGEIDAEVLQATSGVETLLRRFAEAERRRYENELAQWKEQLKTATMIVIGKQVEIARAKWMQSQSANEAKVAQHYRRLKVLADKVARQKQQIQQAKKELEQMLEAANRLHNEFAETRHVLDGRIGAIDALNKGDDPAES